MADPAILSLIERVSGENRPKVAQTRLSRYESALLVELIDAKFTGQCVSDVLHFLLMRELAPFHMARIQQEG